jgi:sRNA-binding carbon storage regulator CsrA
MPLHITVSKGDRIILSDGVIIDVRRIGSQPQLSIEAPPEIEIQTIYKDIKKQAKLGRKDER